MGDISIKKVENKKDLKKFIMLPWKIYKGDENWVPPLIMDMKERFNPKKNPYYEHADVELFIAERDGETVGRIACHIDHNHNKFHNEKAAFFGFFEVIKDYEVAKALFDHAVKWGKKKGMEFLRGPMSFGTNDECAFLLEGYDSPPAVMMPYNPPYYQEYIERYGFKKAKDLYAYFVDFRKVDDDLFEKIKKKAFNKNFKIRRIRLDDPEEAERIKDVYNSAWGGNWGFVPLTEEEFLYTAKQLRKIVIPDLALVAEREGKIVGFNLCIPDINQALKKINGRLFPFGIFKFLYYSRKIRTVRGLTLGIIKKYRYILGPLFYSKIGEISKKKGYFNWEIGWVLEDNNIVNNAIMRKLNPKLYKKYRIFAKDL